MNRILLVAMFDSVHTANWLKRIQNMDAEIYIYPSKKYRKLHPDLAKIITSNENIRIVGLVNKLNVLPGYFNFAVHEILGRRILYFGRKSHFLRAVVNIRYDFVHALEIQGAGYLVSEVPRVPEGPKIIVTNWGSDIFYFGKFPEHAKTIRKVLQRADRYSAECNRDNLLATQFGFTGEFLPVIPNSGNFEIPDSKPPSERKQVIIKTYGGTFGLGNLCIDAVELHIRDNQKMNYYFYSTGEEFKERLQNLSMQYPQRVRYSLQRAPITPEELKYEFSQSRIYIGASKSDGISTSFLEALTSGTYPIQTNTSCANEWQSKGVVASVISPEVNEILESLIKACADDLLVDEAAKKNLIITHQFLDKDLLSNLAHTFYL